MLVMNYAGAGVNALTLLHSIGGSSQTVLEACDRYSPKSLIETVGFEPKRFTSKKVAQALAQSAFIRAKHLRMNAEPVFGVGVTATIATNRKKRGDHRCQIAIKDVLGVSQYGLVLKKGRRNRYEEEKLVSQITMKAIIESCGVFAPENIALLDGERLEQNFIANPKLKSWQNSLDKLLIIKKDGKLEIVEKKENIIVLSGSFNPLHEGHKKLAELLKKRKKQEVYFELTMSNAEKNPIQISELRKRALQFIGYAPLIVSRAPLFSQKAEFFPNSSFIVGADTAKRLVEPRFYDNSREKMLSSFDSLKQSGAKFLVAGRSHKELFETLSDISIPKEYLQLFTSIPENQFHEDISSSEIRRRIKEEQKIKDCF